MSAVARTLDLGFHVFSLSLLLAAGCEFPGQPKPADQYVPPQRISSFDVLFQKNCVACHGADGTLGPAPPLNDKLFLTLIPDAELQRVVSEGRAGTLMPAFATKHGGQLTAEQTKIIADGIKTRWGSAMTMVNEAPSYLPTSSGNRQEGAKVFARACAACHGDHGQGGDRAGAIDNPDFLALLSDQALRRYVITGRPDLGMPNYAEPDGRPEGFKPLTSQEVTDVVALLAHWRNGGSADSKGK